jgi:hypothetical protein
VIALRIDASSSTITTTVGLVTVTFLSRLHCAEACRARA